MPMSRERYQQTVAEMRARYAKKQPPAAKPKRNPEWRLFASLDKCKVWQKVAEPVLWIPPLLTSAELVEEHARLFGERWW
jgi:hypothetical protein